jgi:hypothetical protein
VVFLDPYGMQAEHERMGSTFVRNWRALDESVLDAIAKVRKNHGADNVLK